MHCRQSVLTKLDAGVATDAESQRRISSLKCNASLVLGAPDTRQSNDDKPSKPTAVDLSAILAFLGHAPAHSPHGIQTV